MKSMFDEPFLVMLKSLYMAAFCSDHSFKYSPEI